MSLSPVSAAALGFASIVAAPFASTSRATPTDAAPRGKSVSATVETLLVAHGATHAAKLALIEKRKAKRARSRKRFDFWAAVHSQLEGTQAGSLSEIKRSGGEEPSTDGGREDRGAANEHEGQL